MLGNVLKVVARLHPKIRYCQGMNYVAGAMLIVASAGGSSAGAGEGEAGQGGGGGGGGGCGGGPPGDGALAAHVGSSGSVGSREDREVESKVVYVVSAVVSACGMEDFWGRGGTPGMKLAAWQFETLGVRLDPSLWRRFSNSCMGLCDACVAKSFLTLDTHGCPPENLPHVLDAVVAGGRMAIVQVGLRRLEEKRDELMSAAAEEVPAVLRERGGEGKGFIKRALAWDPGEQVLADLEKELALTVLQEQLNDDRTPGKEPPPGRHSRMDSWSQRYGPASSLLPRTRLLETRETLSTLDSQVNADSAVLRRKIGAASREVARLYDEIVMEKVGMMEAIEKADFLQLQKNKIKEQTACMLSSRSDPHLFGDLTALKKKAERVERELEKAAAARDRVVRDVREKEMRLSEESERKEVLSKLLADIIKVKSEEKGRVLREALEV